MKRFMLTILVATQCICGQFVHADSLYQPPLHVNVNFADLDLSGTEGAASLYRRLRAAARQVCAPLDERSRSLKGGALFHSCIADALSTAVAAIDQPLLNSYYRAKLDGHGAVDPKVATR
jgi:UrcA family protein